MNNSTFLGELAQWEWEFILLMIDLTYWMLPYAKAPSDLHIFHVLSHLTLSTMLIAVQLIFAFYIQGYWGTERLSNVPKVTCFERQIQTQRSDNRSALFIASQYLHVCRIVCPREKRSYPLIMFVTIHRVTSQFWMGPWKPLSLDGSGTLFLLFFICLSLCPERQSFVKGFLRKLNKGGPVLLLTIDILIVYCAAWQGRGKTGIGREFYFTEQMCSFINSTTQTKSFPFSGC